MTERVGSAIDDAVDLFVHGAKTYLSGCFLDVQALINKASAIIQNATKTLDNISPSGRDPLVRLLDDQNEMVRTIAAAALWQSQTDRARKTLEHVHRRGITEANMLAYKILLFQGRYNPVRSDPRYEGLFDGGHDPKKFREDTAFRMRALRGELSDTFAKRLHPS